MSESVFVILQFTSLISLLGLLIGTVVMTVCASLGKKGVPIWLWVTCGFLGIVTSICRLFFVASDPTAKKAVMAFAIWGFAYIIVAVLKIKNKKEPKEEKEKTDTKSENIDISTESSSYDYVTKDDLT